MISALRRAWSAFRQPPASSVHWRGWNLMRRLQAAYEAAMPRDDLWTLADFLDADASLMPDKRRVMRARARYEYANNPLVARVVDVWTGDVCGEAGPKMQLHSGSTIVDRFVERAWDKWWRHSNQAAKLRLGVKTEAIDGEAVAIVTSNERLLERQPVSVDSVCVEADRLASPDWSNAIRSNYVDGVHLDPATREPVAYDLLKAHPGTAYLDKLSEMWEHEEFDRGQVLHAFRKLRPEQHRGVCRYVPVLPLSGLHRKYMEAETNRNVLRAAFAFVVKSMAPPADGDEGVVGEGQWWQQVQLPNRSGAGLFLPDGYDINQFRHDGSASEITSFHQIIGGVVAGCFTMPVGRALGVYTNSSYPGVRAEMQPYHRAIATDRYQVWEPLWLDPLYAAWLAEFLTTHEWREFWEELAAQPDAPNLDALDLYETEWNWPERELVVDPSREETARKGRMAMGLSDREREMDSADLEERDRRAAHMFGIEDVVAYRRMVAQATFGVPVPAAQPAAGARGENPAEFGNLGRRQWQNNRKAIRDVLGEVISGEITEAAALQMLQSLGLPEARAQAFIDDARDSRLDDPELTEDPPDTPPPGPDLAAGWPLQANCGTGDGGFQPGNDCGGKGGGGGEDTGSTSSRDRRRVKFEGDEPSRQRLAEMKLAPTDAAGLAGAEAGAEISIHAAADGSLSVVTRHPDGHTQRRFLLTTADGLVVRNELTESTPPQSGFATRSLQQQVHHADRMGVTRIEAIAVRAPGRNGYAHLPKLGYDGPLPPKFADNPFGATRVSDLMSTAAGRDFWQKHGDTIEVTFDPRPGSLSRLRLDAYAESRGWSVPPADYEVES